VVVGKTISHYRILEHLGAGGMGVVYEAEDLRLGRRVAIKFLPPDLARDPQALERFQREARSASALNHPNICTIHEIDSQGDSHFIVMERMHGLALQEKIAGRPLPADEVHKLAVEVASALAAAHASGIVHRDLKPANIFITRDGRAKVLDFGVAKLLPNALARGSDGGETSLTLPGGTPGTLLYMSPEQALGKALDARTDLFSFGAVLYEMATGKAAFNAGSSGAVVDAVLHRTPPPPSRTNPEISPDLDRIIAKALEKDYEMRYQSATELLADLKRLQRDAGPGSHSVPATLSAPRGGSRVTRVAFVMLVLGFVAAAWYLFVGRKRITIAHAGQTSVAVVPFQNFGNDSSMDFLKLALPDQVLTTISYSPGLAVRPFSATAKADPVSAGHDLRADTVVTGHFLRDGNTLQVTLEAVDVDSNRIVWRDTVSGTPQDMIALQRQLADRVRQGLVGALGASAGVAEATRPTNAEAYSLFLRAAGFSWDPEPNRQALAMVQRAVALDPGFAPAWQALAERYYHDYQDGGGGPAALDLCRQAAEKSHKLDPNLATTLRGIVVLLTDAGDLEHAYDNAQEMLLRRPDSGDSHFAMSYVLRYAGLAEEAARECDAALALDRSPLFRSCSIAYSKVGNYQRARQVIQQLDPGSSSWAFVDMLDAIRLQQTSDALADAKRTGGDRARFQVTCVERRLSDSEAGEFERIVMRISDPETRLLYSSMLASCGKAASALRVLESTVGPTFCGAVDAETDPLLASLRTNPEFVAAVTKAKECRERFLAHRAK
jgi:eukaryotic-like serine/threonine-protein kinase